mmetsp:Transcript_18475/g.37346  ORF Transcript_18475/g.37346 Transcript_18475/m.37346 type:complete len:234 (-) Transcript_18475:11-712(-)
MGRSRGLGAYTSAAAAILVVWSRRVATPHAQSPNMARTGRLPRQHTKQTLLRRTCRTRHTARSCLSVGSGSPTVSCLDPGPAGLAIAPAADAMVLAATNQSWRPMAACHCCSCRGETRLWEERGWVATAPHLRCWGFRRTLRGWPSTRCCCCCRCWPSTQRSSLGPECSPPPPTSPLLCHSLSSARETCACHPQLPDSPEGNPPRKPARPLPRHSCKPPSAPCGACAAGALPL